MGCRINWFTFVFVVSSFGCMNFNALQFFSSFFSFDSFWLPFRGV